MANTILGRLLIQIAGNTASLDTSLKSTAGNIANFQKGIQKANQLLSNFGVGFGLFQVTNVVKDAIKINADFEKQLQSLKAVTGATESEFNQLRQSALDLGKATQFSSKEVAELQTEFARLGFNTQEILDATEATINLSVATGEDLAKSADVAGSTLRAFGLNASEMHRVVDVMAEGFNKSALGIGNFSEAIKYVAPIAAQAGLSIEETTAMLGTLADNGIRGSAAGTALRKIISDLGTESGDTAERIAKLAAKGLTGADAMDEVGRTAYAALLVLAKSTEHTDALTEALTKAAGAAKKTADVVSDDLTHDLKELDSAYEALVLSGEKNTDVFRQLTQEATGFLRALSDPDNVFGQILDEFGAVTFGAYKYALSLVGIGDAAEMAAGKSEELAEKNRAIESTVKAAFDSGNVEAYIKALDQNIYKEDIIAKIRAKQAEDAKKATAAAIEQAKAISAPVGIIAQLQERLKAFEEAKKNAFSVEAIAQFNDKIHDLRDEMDMLNASTAKLSGFGRKVLNQEAGTTSVEPIKFQAPPGSEGSEFGTPTVPTPDMGKVREHFEELKTLYEDAGMWSMMSAKQQQEALRLLGDEQDIIKQKQEEMRSLAIQVGEAFGQFAADAIAGNKNVFQSILQTVAKLIPLFFKMSIAGVTAGAAGTAAPPPIILALAAVGIAGISAIFSKIGGSSGGVSASSAGASSGTNVQRLPAVSNSNQFDFEKVTFEIEGTKLIGVMNNQEYKSRRTG